MNYEQLKADVQQQLLYIGYEQQTDWSKATTYRGQHVYDALIVGGGQSGLCTAFALKKERISNIIVLDENEAGQEGPWVTYARMQTLRTPKQLTSIDLGIPALTFRYYWTALHGAESFDAIDKIPRQDWMDYLKWYRDVLNLPVKNGVTVQKVTSLARTLFEVQTSKGTFYARKVVLATGIQGGGEWHVPAFIRDALPRSLYAHTSEAIDVEALKGKKVGILGGGASAYDNADHILAAGAKEAHVFVRRKSFNRVNPMRQLEQSGLIDRYSTLTDDEKYRAMAHFFQFNQPPTNDTYNRACQYDSFYVHLDCGWERVERYKNGVRVHTSKGIADFDYLIISTGLISNPALRPELAPFHGRLLTWQNAYTAPTTLQNDLLDAHPYLTPQFEFQANDAAYEDDVHGLYAFNYGALISCGVSASALSGLRFAVPKLVQSIADSLFVAQKETIIEDYLTYDVEEFVGELPKRALLKSV